MRILLFICWLLFWPRPKPLTRLIMLLPPLRLPEPETIPNADSAHDQGVPVNISYWWNAAPENDTRRHLAIVPDS